MHIRNMTFAISLIGMVFLSPVIANTDSSIGGNNTVPKIIDLSAMSSIHTILPTTVAINGAISGGIHEFSKGYKKALKGAGAGLIGGGIVGKVASLVLISNIINKNKPE